MFAPMNVLSMNTEPGPPENCSCKSRSCADAATRALRRCQVPFTVAVAKVSLRTYVPTVWNDSATVALTRQAPLSTETVMSGPSLRAQTVMMNVVFATSCVPSLPALHSASLCTLG